MAEGAASLIPGAMLLAATDVPPDVTPLPFCGTDADEPAPRLGADEVLLLLDVADDAALLLAVEKLIAFMVNAAPLAARAPSTNSEYVLPGSKSAIGWTNTRRPFSAGTT